LTCFSKMISVWATVLFRPLLHQFFYSSSLTPWEKEIRQKDNRWLWNSTSCKWKLKLRRQVSFVSKCCPNEKLAYALRALTCNVFCQPRVPVIPFKGHWNLYFLTPSQSLSVNLQKWYLG
jgi:hypothetical protein